MHLPNYRDGSIVNLMQSILAGLGASGAGGGAHGHLADLGPEEIADARHVVLLVVDGLGQAQLDAGPAPALRASLRGTMTSVFPSTTATAVTTFLTGLAPVEHAVTGWFMWLREIDSIVAPLPFTTRVGDSHLGSFGISPADVFAGPSVFERVRADCHVVQPADLVDSSYSRAHTRGAASKGLRGARKRSSTRSSTSSGTPGGAPTSPHTGRCSIRISHESGVGREPEARRPPRGHRHCSSERLRAGLAGTGTLLVATADHGFIDIRHESRLDVDSVPGLAPMLARPLCGEPRLAYCYVRDECRADFAERAGEALGGAARVVDAESMIEDGWFGLGEPHPRLRERVGDFALVMRDDFAIRDRIADEKPFLHVGVHGGVSREEMRVPLVVVPAS